MSTVNLSTKIAIEIVGGHIVHADHLDMITVQRIEGGDPSDPYTHKVTYYANGKVADPVWVGPETALELENLQAEHRRSQERHHLEHLNRAADAHE